MRKTTVRFDWESGYTKARRLSRSFETMEEAARFADGKADADIYRSKGKYKVEWLKVSNYNDKGDGRDEDEDRDRDQNSQLRKVL